MSGPKFVERYSAEQYGTLARFSSVRSPDAPDSGHYLLNLAVNPGNASGKLDGGSCQRSVAVVIVVWRAERRQRSS